MGIKPTQATANSKLQGAYMISVFPGDIKQPEPPRSLRSPLRVLKAAGRLPALFQL